MIVVFIPTTPGGLDAVQKPWQKSPPKTGAVRRC